MNTCEYLARVGFTAALQRCGGPTEPAWADEDDQDALDAAQEAARQEDHRRVREWLLAAKPESRSGNLDGAKWLGMIISWPDRVPGLKTWAGQSSLPKIIAAHQRRLGDGDLFAARSAYRTSKGEGPSGLDATTCQDALDVGFSPAKLGMDIECRPGVELLAILGLETLPLVSFAARECGFVHDGELWRFAVEARDGGYYHRWGDCQVVGLG